MSHREKDMSQVSVIIPVYNVEKYIDKCLESVVNQTYNDIEIIVVNDGTKDNSEEIINNYLKKYNNVKYLIKENGGLSDARNYGVKYATGEYIAFLDADDYLDYNLFSNLQSYMNQNIDLIKYKMIRVDENGNNIDKINGPVFEKMNGQQAFNELFCKDTMMQPAWLYLYKKSFWDENKFEYPVGKLHEDFAITSLIILRAKSVVSTDIYGYYYVQSSERITRGNEQSKVMRRAMDLLEHYDYMIGKIKGYNLDKTTEENVKIYYTNCIILKLGELSKENKKIYKKEIENRGLYNNIKARNIKQLIKKLLLKMNVNLYLKMR